MPLGGVKIVFTGKMSLVRTAIESHASQHGADVQRAVRQDTEWLVAGRRTGRVKLERAKQVGARILSEDDYFQEVRTRAAQATPEEASNTAAPAEKVDTSWANKIGGPGAMLF